jgi:hypothetical protein
MEDATTDLIHGVAQIAKAINKTERASYHLLENGCIPGAFKLGGRWSLSLSKFREGIAELQARAAGKAA